MSENKHIIRQLGICDYTETWLRMKNFTQQRDENTPDEIWFLEHPPVYTQGLNGKPEHILYPNNIPIIQTDRGGQVTYHGPGQLIVYFLWDIQRHRIGVRSLVSMIEQMVVDILAEYQIEAHARCDARGIYVADKKIGSIGLKISRGCSYHGLSLNVAMDLSPFDAINPCGLTNMKMTQLSDFHQQVEMEDVMTRFTRHLELKFSNC